MEHPKASNQSTIDQDYSEAQHLAQLHGTNSSEYAAAMDAIEERLAYAADQRQQERSSSFFLSHCEETPDAPECKVYDL
jgi:CP12 domain